MRMDVNTKRGEETTQSLESLVAEVGIEVSSVEEIRRERAQVERKILLSFYLHPAELRQALRKGEAPEDDLVDQWLALDALLSTMDEPDQRGRPRRPTREDESRESGSFAFRVLGWLLCW
jgi:hypothetical protein